MTHERAHVQVWELVRRTVLTGWLLLVDNGKSYLRLIVGLVVCVVALVLLLLIRPYKLSSDFHLALASHVSLVFLFLCALMLKSQQIISDYYGSTATAETIIGIGSSDTIVSFMLIITFAMLLLFLIIAGFQAHQERRMERIEDEYSACTVNPPRLEWRPTRKFAAFLSHYKCESAADARFLHDSLRKMLRCPIYLDSSTLSDLRQLFSDGLL